MNTLPGAISYAFSVQAPMGMVAGTAAALPRRMLANILAEPSQASTAATADGLL